MWESRFDELCELRQIAVSRAILKIIFQEDIQCKTRKANLNFLNKFSCNTQNILNQFQWN